MSIQLLLWTHWELDCWPMHFQLISVNVDQYVVERWAFLFWPLRPLVSALNFLCLSHRENWKSVIVWNVICLFRNRPWFSLSKRRICEEQFFHPLSSSVMFCTSCSLIYWIYCCFCRRHSEKLQTLFLPVASVKCKHLTGCDIYLNRPSLDRQDRNRVGEARGTGTAVVWVVQLHGIPVSELGIEVRFPDS